MSSELIERLEKADSGSGELDYLVEQAVSDWKNLGGGWERHKVTGEERRSFSVAPNYTTSLDAIVSLIGEKLPGWTWGVDSEDCTAILNPPVAWVGSRMTGAKTPALALCIALLRALQASQGSETDG